MVRTQEVWINREKGHIGHLVVGKVHWLMIILLRKPLGVALLCCHPFTEIVRSQ